MGPQGKKPGREREFFSRATGKTLGLEFARFARKGVQGPRSPPFGVTPQFGSGVPFVPTISPSFLTQVKGRQGSFPPRVGVFGPHLLGSLKGGIPVRGGGHWGPHVSFLDPQGSIWEGLTFTPFFFSPVNFSPGRRFFPPRGFLTSGGNPFRKGGVTPVYKRGAQDWRPGIFCAVWGPPRKLRGF